MGISNLHNVFLTMWMYFKESLKGQTNSISSYGILICSQW